MRSGWLTGPKYPCARRAQRPGPVATRTGAAALDRPPDPLHRPLPGLAALVDRHGEEAALAHPLRIRGARARVRVVARWLSALGIRPCRRCGLDRTGTRLCC